MRCNDVRAVLPTFGGDTPVDLAVQRHVDQCAECRSTATQYQSIVRTLGDLGGALVPAPAGLLDETLAAVGGPSVIRAMTRRRKAAVAGAVGAVAAGAAATAVVLVRRRGLRLAHVLAR